MAQRVLSTAPEQGSNNGMHDPDDIGDLSADVARRLALTRRAFGMQQQEFGTSAGMSQPQYNQFETGKRLLTLPYALALCLRYGVTLGWLYRGDPSGLPYSLHEKIREIRRSTRG